MMPNRVVRLFLFLIFSTTLVQAQDRFYHVYVDNDSDAATGCVVNFPAFTSTANGIDTRLTITTNSALPPAITSTTVHNCSGAAFDAGTNTTMAALGLNNGVNGSDVFEAMLPSTALSMNQSDAATLYFATDSSTATDIVLTNSAGGPIVLGFAAQVPALGLLSVVFLLAAFLLLTRRHLSRKITVSIVLVGFVTTAWAMTILIDGQTTDWQSIAPANTDPVNDTSAAGSFADLTAVFATRQGDDFFVRMDVVDVENQAPIADTNNASTLEDNAVVITVTGSDAEGSPLTFSANAPANGTLSAFTVINATSSSVTYTPNADFNGVDSFGLVANDGQVSSAPATVTINVTAVNDEPSFTSGGNVNHLKTGGAYSQAWATNISAGPANEASQNLSFNITGNDNMAIFSVQPAIDAAGTLSFTGVADATGTANITVELGDDGGTANGGDDTSAAVNFTITLQGVNDEPSFTAGADQTVNEDAGAQTVAAWATAVSAGPPDEAGQILTFNITGNTNAALFSAGPAVAADGTLSYTPAADANGSAMITLELMDDGGTANGGDDTSPSQSFNITVNAVNDAPTFTAGGNQNVLEGAGAQTVNAWATAISPGPADEAAQTVSFTVVNDNNALFSVQPDVDAAGNLTYTPAAAALGTANVTVTAVDTGGTANGGVDTSAGQNFTISITAVNDEPSFTAGADQTVNEDAGAQNVAAWATAISAGPPDEAGQNLTFNITANTNAALFSAGPAVAADGTLSYTPAADASGTAMITLELMDDGGTANGGDDTSPPQSFNITVNAVNDEPSFTAGGDQTILENSGAQTVNGWATAISAGPADEAGQTLSFNVTNDNNALFSAQPAVDAAGNLTYTSATNVSGSATVSVSLMDNGGTANGGDDTSPVQTFMITVNFINDAPSFTAGADQTVAEDAGAQTVNGWATAISVGPPDEAGQTPTFNITGNTNAALFAAGPAVAANGDLTYTPAANANGSATITLVLMDDGGTANGGVDTSPPQNFDINVTAVNDPPTVTPPAAFPVTTHIRISVPDGASDLLAGAIDVEGTSMSIQGTGIIATSQGGTVTANTTTGAFTYDPPADFTGADTFNYQVCDSGTPLPAACSPMVMVTLNVSGNTVWFIDDTAAAGGDGTLQAPFNSLAAFNGSAGPSAGDFVYLATGSGTYSGAGINLANNQILFGQGTTGAFDTITGITAASLSVARPTLGGTRPMIISTANAVNLASGNTVRGLNVGNTTGIALAGGVVGALTVDQLAISGTGGALNVGTSGDLTAANFDAINASPAAAQDGIRLRGLTGTLTFNNPVTLNATSGRGFDLESSTATVSITNTLDIDTTTGIGFNALNGGTISVTGANSTVNTTNGRAVNINNTTIAAANVTFQSVNSGASADLGINLVNTGALGGFRITGVGTTAGSGGTIANKTGPNNSTIAGTGIFMNNTSNVQLALMQLNDFQNYAIRGTNVNGFSLIDSVISGTNGTTAFIDDEAAMRFVNLSGVSVLSGNNISGGIEDQIRIVNTAGTLDLTINDSASNQAIIGLDHTPAGTNGNDGILLETQMNANATMLVDGVAFTGARGDNIQANALATSTQNVTIRNSTFTNTHPNIVAGGGGVTLSGAGTGAGINITYSVTGNTFNNANGNSFTSNYVSGAGAVVGTIANNMVGTMGGTSGSAAGSGISVGTAQNIGHNSTVNNNTVANIAGFTGLDFAHDGNGAFNSNITNNNVSGLSGFALAAMNSTLAGGGIATGTACLDIENNSLDASGAPFGLNAIFLDELNAAATYNLPGFAGSPNGEFAFSCPAGTASNDGHGLLSGQGNTFVNGAFPSFPGIMLDASLVCGKTGVGTTCP